MSIMKTITFGIVLVTLLLGFAGKQTAYADLISYYNFDETSGTIAHDSVGGIDGTLSGGAVFAPGAGISGGAIRLDSTTNSFVNMGDHFSFDGTHDFSIQAWFQTLPGSTDSMFVFSKHHSTIVAGYFLGLNDSGDGVGDGSAHIYLGTGGGYNGGATNQVVNDGNWHQAVEVFKAGAQSSFYIDGALADSRAAVTFNTIAEPFLVGGIGNPSGTPVGSFTGLIDEVRVYDNALTSSDVLALYRLRSVPEPSTIALLVFGLPGAILVLRRGVRTPPSAYM